MRPVGNPRLLPEKVSNDGVDDTVRQRVLLVEENAQEYRAGAAVVHLGDLVHRRGGVDDRDRVLRDDAADDYGLPQRAVSSLSRKGGTKK